MGKTFEFDIRARADFDDQLTQEGIRSSSTDIQEGVIYERNGVKETAFLVDHGPVKPAFGYLQRPEERLSRGLIYGTLHLQAGGWAVYAQKMIYKEMFFRSHGKIPNWGLPLAKWSAETLKI